MTFAVKRLLIINKQLSFTVRIKGALEQLGGFQVSPFTTEDAALDHLRNQPHDVALVDFTMRGISEKTVERLRAIQPGLPIIASPQIPQVEKLVNTLDLQGIIDVPCSARELMPVIEAVLRGPADDTSLTETEQAPPLTADTETAPMPPSDSERGFSSLDSILVRTGGLDEDMGTETLDVDMSDAAYADNRRKQIIEFVLQGDISELLTRVDDVDAPQPDDTPQAIEIFQQLAAEEPPMPTLEESGTVGDLRSGMGDADLHEVAEVMMKSGGDSPALPPVDDDADDASSDTASLVLKSALDDSSPLIVSLSELLTSLEQQFPAEADGIKPLPSWVKEVEQYVREPDFLEDARMTAMDASEPIDLGDQTTRSIHPEDIITNTSDMETDRMPAESPPQPPTAPPAGIQDAYADEEHAGETDRIQATADELDQQEAQELQSELGAPEHDDAHAVEKPAGKTPIITATSGDPRVAQLALALTQASLELTADATLLARDGEIVAHAGNMPDEDITDLLDTIANDWEAGPGEARIRFITLPSSGQDYMLYSRQTEADFTLSMIFAGNMPLRVIRRQSDKLVEALTSTSQPESSPAALMDDLKEQEELEALEREAAEEEEAAQESTAMLALQRQTLEAVQPDAPEKAADVEPESAAVEDKPAAETAIEPYSGPMTGYTYIWLINDPDQPLTEPVAQAIVTKLDSQLTRENWRIRGLHVYEDYIYMLADVPGDALAHQIIPELKRRSATIAQEIEPGIEIDALWSDSYFALTPARELDIEEIQRFINFGRMR